MNYIILIGETERCLWPLSNDVRSKQFLKIFTGEDGEYESMIQRTYREIKNFDRQARVLFVTSQTQVSAIYNQIGDDADIVIEPNRKGTFPAIALATLYLREKKNISRNETIVVCPADVHVNSTFFETLCGLHNVVEDDAKIVIMGVEAKSFSKKYGYIVPDSKNYISCVCSFEEKPNEENIREYISKGALWNTGVFAFRMDYILERIQELIGVSDYSNLINKYSSLKSSSFDCAIVEHESCIKTLRYNDIWGDIDTWDALMNAMEEDVIGNGMISTSCSDVKIINEMNVPVLAVGVHDVVISASPEGILVSDRTQSSFIKPYIDSFEKKIMYAEKSWGNYRVIDCDPKALTIRVFLKARHSMNYHSHKRRDEVWIVLSGLGRAIVDEYEQNVKRGDIITMAAGSKHTIFAIEDLVLIEVQVGDNINVNDKVKYNLE